jgi:hypothetical protein
MDFVLEYVFAYLFLEQQTSETHKHLIGKIPWWFLFSDRKDQVCLLLNSVVEEENNVSTWKSHVWHDEQHQQLLCETFENNYDTELSKFIFAFFAATSDPT